MKSDRTGTGTDVDPYMLLGVPPGVSAGEVRAAYLSRVKEFPPDRSPEMFERIRDAYELLRDPRKRAASLLCAVDPSAPLASLVGELSRDRCFLGPRPWLEAMADRPR